MKTFLKDWAKIFQAAVVILAVVFTVRTIIVFIKSPGPANKPADAALALNQGRPNNLRPDDPENPNYHEDIRLQYLKVWSKRVYVYPHYIKWDTSPMTPIAVMRNDDPHDVVYLKPGDPLYDLGNPRYIRFATLKYATTITVDRPPEMR